MTLKSMHSDNVNELIFYHLDINSIRKRFELLKEHIKDNIDILMIFERKLRHIVFSQNQFSIEGFSTPYKFDRDSNGEFSYMSGRTLLATSLQ